MALAAILVVAAGLRGWNLRDGGIIVPYYFAGVRSQLQGWHNFFFNAFDPAGFLSIDKPPVAFWLQTLSAKLLGFDTFGVLLPQVAEGLAAICLLYILVRRHFGAMAGLLAALFLALTPVSVAVDRTNNTESCLTLVLLLATWALFGAVERGRLRQLLVAATAVGIGFNVKMLAAIGVVPAFAMAYIVWAPPLLPRRIGQLAAAAGVLAIVSLSWCGVYDLTPVDSRPFVDSSTSNSMLELIVGHNFVDRFTRPSLSTLSGQPASASVATSSSGAAQPPRHDAAPAGPLRLLITGLVTQAGWLYPLALIGGIAAWRSQQRNKRIAVTVWAGWAVVYGAVFSAAGGFFEGYYLAVMAPPLCALSAIGAARGWELRHAGGPAALGLPAGLAAAALWQAYIVDFNVSSARLAHDFWLFAALLGVALVAAGGAIALRRHPAGRSICCAAGILVLLALPGAWCLGISLGRVWAGYGTGLQAGLFSGQPPSVADMSGNRVRFRLFLATDPKLIAFLEQHRDGAPYLLATGSASPAAPIIVKTGAPVMVLGHFSGWFPILTEEQFAQRVAAGQVKYALVGDGSRGLGHLFAAPPALNDWIRAHGRIVDPALWSSAAAGPDESSPAGPGVQLYDLRPAPDGG